MKKMLEGRVSLWERNTKKKGKQREKREKNKKIREREKFGFGGTWATANV